MEKSYGFSFTGWKATVAVAALFSLPFIMLAIGAVIGRGSCIP